MSIAKLFRKVMNVKPAAPHVKRGSLSKETSDILNRASDQGERIRKMEEPLYAARNGNPFGDILERRIDRGMNHV